MLYCSQTFCSKHGFPILLMVELPSLFPKYSIEDQYIKTVKSNLKDREVTKRNIKAGFDNYHKIAIHDHVKSAKILTYMIYVGI